MKKVDSADIMAFTLLALWILSVIVTLSMSGDQQDLSEIRGEIWQAGFDKGVQKGADKAVKDERLTLTLPVADYDLYCAEKNAAAGRAKLRGR